MRVSPAPRWLVVLACAGLAYLALPLAFMGVRVPWDGLGGIVASESTLAAMELSLRTCLASIVVDLVVGVPLAVALSREWRGVRLARVLVALPLSLPPVVAGLALLATFGRKGLLGSHLEAMGVTIAFSTVAVVMAQVFVSLPFLVVTLEAALRARPTGMEETAAALGAGPSRILWRITLPMVLPGLSRGAALALARCLGEFGATITFAGSLQAVTRTMPLEIYLTRESDSDSALALGMILVLVSACVVALTEWTPRRRREPAPPEDPDSEEWSEAEADIGSDAAGLARGVPVSVRGTIRERGWQIDVDVEAGAVVAVMGRNGSGKSTLAELLAGRLALDSGRVRIGERTVDGPEGFVPARFREVAIVSQNPRLFGHMSVLANVAFPLRCRGWGTSRAREAARLQLRAVGCERLASRRAETLSGGQAARVALARALVFHPKLLVLDEPTAALDAQARSDVGRVLARRLGRDRTTTLLITHDVAEALQFASRLFVIDAGRVVERGRPADVIASPTSSFAAGLAGLNVVRGSLTRGPDGLPGIVLGEGRLVAAADPDGGGLAEGSPVMLMFQPESVALHLRRPTGSARGKLACVVESVEAAAGLVTVRGRLPGGQRICARVTTVAWAELGLGVGESLWCSVEAARTRVVPAAR